MDIKSLYRDYFNKSRIFLYPLLDIKRGSSITPIETYISWNDMIIPKDRKFICLYHLRDDIQYRQFEKVKLFGNPLFDDFKELEDNKVIYIFNFDKYGEDWNNFLKGKYSKLSPELRKKIKEFFKSNPSNSVRLDSFLNPNKYFNLYADLLGVDSNLLKEVGELCSFPDIEKETLILNTKSLNSVNPINKIL